MSNFSKEIYNKKKRRLIGELIEPAEIKTDKAWLSIHKSSKDDLLTYESSGLVVSINGSGTLPMEHHQCEEAGKLAQFVHAQKGIVMNGGRSSGVMGTSTIAADKQQAGIIFPELEKEKMIRGEKVVVNSPQPRIELLATCTPVIVIFRGGLGTLMILMRSIVHIRNREFHPDQLPQMVFVSNYWIGLLSTMMNMDTLPKEFLKELKFFNSASEVISNLPTNK